MDRQLVYPGATPRAADQLQQNKSTMIALGYFMQAVLGSSVAVDGLAVTPTIPASLSVNVATGSLYSLQNVDNTAYGVLAADTADQIVKQGIPLLATTPLSCPAPSTSGQSIVYLVQVAYQDQDNGALTLNYYNASNPSAPFNGPNNNGVSQATVRQGVCLIGVKAGIAATTGTQVAPSPDAGYTGIYTVTVANGQTSITSGNIAQIATAPFINPKLTSLLPTIQSGKTNYAVDTSGAANTITVALSPAITSLTSANAGLKTRVKLANTVTGPTVLNVGPGNVAVTDASGNAMTYGRLVASGVYDFVFDGTYWQVQGLPARVTLAANTTYYVATTGNDSNSGASSSPWLTIQRAINYLLTSVDLNGYNVTISVANGTYTTPVIVNAPFVGAGSGTGVTLQGNTSTPSSCIISTTAASGISAQNGAFINVAGFQLQTTTSGHALFSEYFSRINISGNCNFGAVASLYNHIHCSDHGRVDITTSYSISGNAANHYLSNACSGIVIFGGVTCTLSGTPAFSNAFTTASNVAIVQANAATFSGSATGSRYAATANGVIQTGGSGASYFPGSSAGSTATGGQYV